MKLSLTEKVPVFLIAILAAVCILPSSYAQARSSSQPDVVVRIGRIEQTLDLIDDTFDSDVRASERAPSKNLRTMLMGTHWIDPDRAVVIGLNFDPEQMQRQLYAGTLLVPFAQPNEDFAARHGARKKDDYYLVPLQQHPDAPVDPELASTLAEASEQPVERFVSVDIAASRILGKTEQQIKQLLSAMEEQMAAAPQESPNAAATAQAGTMLEALLKIGRQVETLSFGGDLGGGDASFSINVLALADSELAGAMTGKQELPAGRLGNISPAEDLQMQLRSRPYDIAAAAGFITDSFGEFYKSMGIDLEQAVQMFTYFTGETVGAMSIAPSGMRMEMAAALNPDKKIPADFLESEYIPWLMDTGPKMARFYKDQRPGLELDSVFTRTENTTVDGNIVVGVEARMPMINPEAEEVPILKMPIRMTRLNNCLLAASDDARMKFLISKVSDLEPADAKGPLVTMTMDWTRLLKAAAAMDPAQDTEALESLPDLGDLVYTVDLQDRSMHAEYAMKLEDMKRFAESVQAMQARAQTGPAIEPYPGKASQKSSPESTQSSKPQASSASSESAGSSTEGDLAEQGEKQEREKTEQKFTEDDPQYWMDKGGLYASYGNQDAAIKSFRKALELDPENIRAAFSLGLAYAENGDYDRALGFINKAVLGAPENGNYLYGRGWVHLLACDSEKAMQDIGKAAELGNPDALEYMNSIAPRR
ncbi:MAG: tetratricopeptide repeat protein [Desulfobacterales bacterium]|nr:tetratricopeptide repeat protein [Desulfobacterales bacterium]